MVSLYNIKPTFQLMLFPLLKPMHRMRITANHITIASIGLSLVIGVLFWNADKYTVLFLALPIGLLLRMMLNALDGMMARYYKQSSAKGEILNETGDIISDVFIFFPLLKFESAEIYLVIAFLCLGLFNEFTGLLGKVITGKRRYDGPMGKSDRAFVIAIYGLLQYLAVPVGLYAAPLFILLNILLIVSCIIRIQKTLYAYGNPA